jgi:hypothetical protein
MTTEQAANELTEQFQSLPWFTAVGVGIKDQEPCLYLYVKSQREVPEYLVHDGWRGYPVEIRRMGTPRINSKPLAS